METSDTVRISNNGNSQASFYWHPQTSDSKLFSMRPMEGLVAANSFVDC